MQYREPLNTPVMKQYLELKSQYPDALLFFRMGDFYELFLDDAVISAPIMDVALTKRQGSVPMAGVPYHSAEIYIHRLLQAGKKIAIAEQMEDPANPRLMQRKVVRILTPGTLIEENLIKSHDSQYLMAIATKELEARDFGVVFVDISTGEFLCYEILPDSHISIRDLYASYQPREILIPFHLEDFLQKELQEKPFYSVLESWKATIEEGKRKLKQVYQLSDAFLKEFQESPVLGSLSLVLYYLEKNFPNQKISIEKIKFLKETQHLILDEKTIKNLNLFEPAEISLYHLFQPVTAKGKRLLKDYLLHPLLDRKEIEKRLNLVEYFFHNDDLRLQIRSLLAEIFDIERILSRIELKKSSPRELRNLVASMKIIEDIANLLKKNQVHFSITVDEDLRSTVENLDMAITDTPPVQLGNAPFLKKGWNSEYDEFLNIKERGTEWILEFEQKERQRTGLQSLKVGYNRISGYYIEISKVQARSAPPDYEKKQTLVNCERFTCPQLKEIETKLLSAEEMLLQIEEKFFQEFQEQILGHKEKIREIIHSTGYLDVIISFADVAKKSNWSRPEWNENKELILKESRHPVVEKFLPKDSVFVPNDVYLNTKDRSLAIITGPNMAGKSTYIRQIALIQILAQTGSFVPAKEANLSLVDRIFTRVGAGDNLAKGESTFLSEMLETAHILHHYTEDSLIIMDEVGRGTATYDGLAIAWAIVEHLTEKVRPKTLFATHYHELTALDYREGVFNLSMDVLEHEGEILFLHKVKEGAMHRSFGIYVAKLAGLPGSVIRRAQELLENFEKQRTPHLQIMKLIPKKKTAKQNDSENLQIEIF